MAIGLLSDRFLLTPSPFALIGESFGLSPKGYAVTAKSFRQTGEGFGICGKVFRMPANPFAESPINSPESSYLESLELLGGAVNPAG